MAFSLNKIMLIGNLGKDAENRFTTDNVSVFNFSVATTYSYKNKNGEWTDETTWHNVVAFNLSEFYKNYLKKGRKVYVEGRLVSRTYEDKDKIKRTVYEVRADRIIPLEYIGETNKDVVEKFQPSEDIPGEELDSNDDLPF
jgi:single-strand DNA-binding protein